MVVQEKRYTLDEYRAFTERPENRNRLFELINGFIVEKGQPYPPGIWNAQRPMRDDPAPLVMMVKTPLDSLRELRRTAEDYLQTGTKTVWLMLPEAQRVEVYFGGARLCRSWDRWRARWR
ncbi:MAG: hypothetical protein IPO91_17905 [Chloroflexi bacterium]|nr:hypothetical protein [Chloroflexota bacterium]